MSLWQRGKWFWADFSVNGLRYRVPLRDNKGRKILSDDAHREMAARSEQRAMEMAERGQLGRRMSGCLAGRAIIQTDDHGGIGDDDGIAATLVIHLETAFDRGDGHRSVRKLLGDR